MGFFLIESSETAITGNVSVEDGGELTFPSVPLLHRQTLRVTMGSYSIYVVRFTSVNSDSPEGGRKDRSGSISVHPARILDVR